MDRPWRMPRSPTLPMIRSSTWNCARQMGIRPGGFGLLMTQSFADELIYSAKGNEVILIKYL